MREFINISEMLSINDTLLFERSEPEALLTKLEAVYVMAYGYRNDGGKTDGEREVAKTTLKRLLPKALEMFNQLPEGDTKDTFRDALRKYGCQLPDNVLKREIPKQTTPQPRYDPSRINLLWQKLAELKEKRAKLRQRVKLPFHTAAAERLKEIDAEIMEIEQKVNPLR